jgi:hypothetical protein
MPRTKVAATLRKASDVLIVLGSAGLLFAACGPAGVGSGASGSDTQSRSGGQSGSGTNNGSGSTSGFGGDFSFDSPDGPIVTDAGASGGDEFGTDVLLECGFNTFNVERAPPDVLVVLDRSGSMMKNVAGQCVNQAVNCTNPVAGSLSRWAIAKTALDTVIGTTEQNIFWGMKLYPTCKQPGGQIGNDDPGRCDFPVGTRNACAIEGGVTTPALGQQRLISETIIRETPSLDSGATPTGLAVTAGVALLKSIQTKNPKFILLVTDGDPTCDIYTGANCPANTNCSLCEVGKPCDKINASDSSIRAVRDAAAAGIPVFVLGFAIPDAGPNNAAHVTLNAMALAGGRSVNNATYKYFNADDQASLTKALDEIAASTVSCTFALDEAPAADAVAFVTVDNRTLPNDTMDGWSFGSGRNSIIFSGTACARLKSGDFKKTAITFGCPQKLPEPPPVVE